MLHVKLSHSNNRMWDRSSSCLDLYRFLPPEKEFKITPATPRRCSDMHAKSQVLLWIVIFLGDTCHGGDFRFILRWTNNSAVLSLHLSCLVFNCLKPILQDK